MSNYKAESGTYNATVTNCFVGTQDTSREKGVVIMDLVLQAQLRWDGRNWVPCQYDGSTRLWFNKIGENDAYTVLAALGWNGDFDNPEFSTPTMNFTCYYEGEYARWRPECLGQRSRNAGKVDKKTAAVLAGRFQSFAAQQSAATAPATPQPSAAVDPAPAPVATPQPAAPTTQQQLASAPAQPAPFTAPPSEPEALPGQGDDDIPF